MKRTRGWLLACVLMVAAGCDELGSGSSHDDTQEKVPEICNDGVDNNDNGWVDCEDRNFMGCGGDKVHCGRCGDGVLGVGEMCDDGNTIDWDSCSKMCVPNFPTCGNGVADPAELCYSFVPFPEIVGAGTIGQAALVDLASDQRPEIVALSPMTDRLVVFEINAEGQPGPATTYPLGSGALATAAADFNHDGWIDIVTANGTASTLTFLFGDGRGGLRPAEALRLQRAPTGLVVGDLDGNGALDIVVQRSGGVDIFVRDSMGLYTRLTSIEMPGNHPLARIADIDLDGHHDIITAGNGVVTVMQNQGAALSFVTASYRLSTSTGGLGLSDFDRDGDLDVAMPDQENLIVADNDGKGQFFFQRSLESAGTPGGIAVGDFDGDGDDDVFVRTWDTSGPQGAIIVSDGRGTFTLGRQVGQRMDGPSAADLNGDRRADIVGRTGLLLSSN